MDEKDYDAAYERIRSIIGNLSSMPRESKPLEHGKGLFVILAVLAEAGGSLHSGDIARRTKVGTGRVATALNVLEAKCYVRRSVPEEDRRKVLVSLTEEGWACVHKLRSSFCSTLEDLVRAIGQERFFSFLDTYVEISAALARRKD